MIDVCLCVRVTFIKKLHFQVAKTLSLFELYRKSEKGELYEVIKKIWKLHVGHVSFNFLLFTFRIPRFFVFSFLLCIPK